MDSSEVKEITPLLGNILGLTGRKRSGKDSVGEHLVEEYGFTRYAFADPLKKGCQIIFGFTDEQMWGKDKEVIDEYWGISARTAAQKIGTEIFQFEIPKHIPELADLGRAFWVYRFAKWYEAELTKNPDIKVVVTDVRFPFEADMIKSLGGSIIKIVRPNQSYQDMHASETEMDSIPFDFLVDNNGTLEDLEAKVDKIYHQIFI